MYNSTSTQNCNAAHPHFTCTQKELLDYKMASCLIPISETKASLEITASLKGETASHLRQLCILNA